MSIGTVAMMIAALTVPGVVDKGPDFQPYKAPLPAFSGGAGGDHVDALGIEVWSQGSPARPRSTASPATRWSPSPTT